MRAVSYLLQQLWFNLMHNNATGAIAYYTFLSALDYNYFY